jgi:hypothetical protein
MRCLSRWRNTKERMMKPPPTGPRQGSNGYPPEQRPSLGAKLLVLAGCLLVSTVAWVGIIVTVRWVLSW